MNNPNNVVPLLVYRRMTPSFLMNYDRLRRENERMVKEVSFDEHSPELTLIQGSKEVEPTTGLDSVDPDKVARSGLMSRLAVRLFVGKKLNSPEVLLRLVDT